jgi:TIR domain
MRAFLSYQTEDRLIAAEIARALGGFNVSCFMAHEHIEVSQEWQNVILKELEKADIFVAVLSRRYLLSPYCIQESGIAVYRLNMTIIPVSIDETVSPGFMRHIQSKRVTPGNVDKDLLLSGIAKHDFEFAIEQLIVRLRQSGSFRSAERNFERLSPYLGEASRKHHVAILRAALENQQIAHADLCVREYLPPILRKYGDSLKDEERQRLEEIFASYAEP